MEYLKFELKLFISLSITFIMMTVVGTLTHELGHYSVSKILGYEAGINYQSSSFWDTEMSEFLNKTYNKYAVEIENNTNYPDKEKYLKISKKYHDDTFWIILGGPLQTMLTGTLGFILLLVFRNKYITSNKVYFWGWALIFISLFWLRQFANLFVGFLTYILKGQTSQRNDEARLANYLDLNIWTIEIIPGIIALGILFKVLTWLPKNMVLTFILSGLVGGILGYYLWLIKFGKYIMP